MTESKSGVRLLGGPARVTLHVYLEEMINLLEEMFPPGHVGSHC